MNDDMELNKFKYPVEQVGVVDDFYREIFFEKEYDRYGSKVEPGDVVIDFGAFVGMFSHFALTKGAKHVYAVEGEKSHYECLEANTRDFQNITAYHGWVSDRRDDIVNPGLYNVERIMDENNLTSVDYLKMNPFSPLPQPLRIERSIYL
jgi:predicted RNA methylase